MKVAASRGLTVVGNRELIGQAIANLIDNALKYGAPQTRRRPRRRSSVAARREGAEIAIEVADHGPGIPIERSRRVLDRFVRLEGARSRPGSGLGLSLAAAVARLHGGAVRLEDNAPGLKVRRRCRRRPSAAPARRRGGGMSAPLAERIVRRAAPRRAVARRRRGWSAARARPRARSWRRSPRRRRRALCCSASPTTRPICGR